MCITNDDISLRFLVFTIPCTYSFTVRSLDQILKNQQANQKKKKEVEKKVEKRKSQYQDGKKEKMK